MKMAFSIPLVAGLLVASLGCQHNLVHRHRGGGCTDCQADHTPSSSASRLASSETAVPADGIQAAGHMQPGGGPIHRLTDGHPLGLHGHHGGCSSCAAGAGYGGGHGLLPGAHHGHPVRVAPLPHGYESYMSSPANGGPPGGTYGYPYYTTRGPRDFLLDNPPSIGY
jgi:hypothetical protein